MLHIVKALLLTSFCCKQPSERLKGCIFPLNMLDVGGWEDLTP
jgi:hypothetical protein